MSLFQTDAWQRSWWQTWGDTEGFSLIRAAASGASGLYLDSYRFRNLIPVQCLQFVGTNYRRLSTPRTEYNTFGLADDEPDVELTRLLRCCSWSEAVFRDIYEGSGDHKALLAMAGQEGWLVRVVTRDRAFSVDTQDHFESYLSLLGSNTRLRLFNRRKVLEGLGGVSLTNYWPNATDEFFETLNEFHQQRWGTPCFNEQSLSFHKGFLAGVEREGGQPDLSVLSSAGRVISVLYNVKFQGTVYNIQSGYFEQFHRKLALGTLHLGYAIENAFSDPECRCFDLLAGGGKNENYKKRLATNETPLVSIMLVRGRLAKFLYRLKR